MKRLLWVILLIPPLLQAPSLPDNIRETEIAKAIYEIDRREFLLGLDTMSFSIDNLYKALLYLEVKQPEMITRQAILETGNFTSYLWVTYNNPFGMKHPKHRVTKSYGAVTNIGYAGYNHWSEACVDMIYFQQWYSSRGWDLDNEYEYFLFNLPYAEDRSYIHKLINIQLSIS